MIVRVFIFRTSMSQPPVETWHVEVIDDSTQWPSFLEAIEPSAPVLDDPDQPIFQADDFLRSLIDRSSSVFKDIEYHSKDIARRTCRRARYTYRGDTGTQARLNAHLLTLCGWALICERLLQRKSQLSVPQQIQVRGLLTRCTERLVVFSP